MGNEGKDIVRVVVESAWWSRINWAQAVAWICSSLSVWTAGKFNVDLQVQIYIVLTIQGIGGLMTIWFRRTTTTITPTAAEMLKGS